MSWSVLLLAAAGAAVLILLVLKFRGRRPRDLLGPPRRKPRHLPGEELERLTALVGRGEEAEVMRQLKNAGYSDKQAKRLLWLMARLAATDGEG